MPCHQGHCHGILQSLTAESVCEQSSAADYFDVTDESGGQSAGRGAAGRPADETGTSRRTAVRRSSVVTRSPGPAVCRAAGRYETPGAHHNERVMNCWTSSCEYGHRPTPSLAHRTTPNSATNFASLLVMNRLIGNTGIAALQLD